MKYSVEEIKRMLKKDDHEDACVHDRLCIAKKDTLHGEAETIIRDLLVENEKLREENEGLIVEKERQQKLTTPVLMTFDEWYAACSWITTPKDGARLAWEANGLQWAKQLQAAEARASLNLVDQETIAAQVRRGVVEEIISEMDAYFEEHQFTWRHSEAVAIKNCADRIRARFGEGK